MTSKLNEELKNAKSLDMSCEKGPVYDFTEPQSSNFKASPKRKLYLKSLAFFVILGCGLSWLFASITQNQLNRPEARSIAGKQSFKRAELSAVSSSPGLENVFQVYEPVLTPQGVAGTSMTNNGQENTTVIAPTPATDSCELALMKYDFANSYGAPFVGSYTPPKCKFNRVTMNFTVSVAGNQYDRLALMYFGDTEVWRTSTAEPTQSGVEWTYIKDMSEYMYFWESPQTLIFDLGNIYNSEYTGIYNTTLTATFFTSQDTVDPADLIIPISARKGSSHSGSVFVVPSDNAKNTLSFPRNANRAVFTVSACGQATEEFWWSNVLQSDVDTFEPADGTLYGYSSWREVQVFIDGHLAGVQWPFPVIFTGGVVPALWHPIVGLDAFDLREHEIDISPWLPLLCDGKEHTFEIKVAGIINERHGTGQISQSVGNDWYVTGKIFVWLDDDTNSVTTGTSPFAILPPPNVVTSSKITQDSTGANETLQWTTDVQREISISSFVRSQKAAGPQTWSQSLKATNYGFYSDYGNVEQNNQSTIGNDLSTGGNYFETSYSYPLYANESSISLPNGNYILQASVIRGIDLGVQGSAVFPSGLQPFTALPNSASLVSGFSGTKLSTTQDASAYFTGNSVENSGFGSTSQVFSFGGIDSTSGATDAELYYRNVEAVNSTIVKDYETLLGAEIINFEFPVSAVPKTPVIFAATSPRQAQGRGRGNVQQVLIQS